MLRALRATTASSPRALMMNPTPTSGRNVTRESSGQWLMPPLQGAAHAPSTMLRMVPLPRVAGEEPPLLLPCAAGEVAREARRRGLQRARSSPRQEVPGDQRDD